MACQPPPTVERRQRRPHIAGMTAKPNDAARSRRREAAGRPKPAEAAAAPERDRRPERARADPLRRLGIRRPLHRFLSRAIRVICGVGTGAGAVRATLQPGPTNLSRSSGALRDAISPAPETCRRSVWRARRRLPRRRRRNSRSPAPIALSFHSQSPSCWLDGCQPPASAASSAYALRSSIAKRRQRIGDMSATGLARALAAQPGGDILAALGRRQAAQPDRAAQPLGAGLGRRRAKRAQFDEQASAICGADTAYAAVAADRRSPAGIGLLARIVVGKIGEQHRSAAPPLPVCRAPPESHASEMPDRSAGRTAGPARTAPTARAAAWCARPAAGSARSRRSRCLLPRDSAPSALTARVQSGQTGASRTASTLSCLRRPATSRACGSICNGSVAPMNE